MPIFDDEMPDPREGDEARWENVYCGRPDDDSAELEAELARLQDDYKRVYGYAPVTQEEREEAAEMQERIVEIVGILHRREIVAKALGA